MEKQRVIFTQAIGNTLAEMIEEIHPDLTFVLVDETTERLCLPHIAEETCMKGVQTIVIPPGDQHKTLDSLCHVWEQLQQHGATRHSLLINLGGGMITDLGGFAAGTFKRGIHCINIPTTLLAMVDASVGGKTGINFGGLKNEIGVFRNASAVIVDTLFLQSLDMENLLSGYAEMLKHGLISTPAMLGELLQYDFNGNIDYSLLARLLEDSVAVKQRIVLEDPTEQGLRKALNLGHTMGHAFESLALRRQKPVLHGYAVAWGLVGELYLSTVKTGFPSATMRQVVSFIVNHYGKMDISCDDYDELIELMTHDKKNIGGEINFSLLSGVGELMLNQTATKKEIEEALDFYRDGQ